MAAEVGVEGRRRDETRREEREGGARWGEVGRGGSGFSRKTPGSSWGARAKERSGTCRAAAFEASSGLLQSCCRGPLLRRGFPAVPPTVTLESSFCPLALRGRRQQSGLSTALPLVRPWCQRTGRLVSVGTSTPVCMGHL